MNEIAHLGARSGCCVREVLPTTYTDKRGTLMSLTFSDVGFEATRSFVVMGEQGAIRGGHAHRAGRQIVMVASGRVRLHLVDHGENRLLDLPADARAVLLEPGVWAELTYLEPGSAIVVYCDTVFDPEDYLGDPIPESTQA
ncbi:MAG TPA: FdtA/QdtA family cupin domain-containing protein [Arachnia sp.]|nr:FdtA/QdtA family cupin domain-containing protein [Arachnia sp.]